MGAPYLSEDFAACRNLCPRQEKSRGDIVQPIAYGVCLAANGTSFQPSSESAGEGFAGNVPECCGFDHTQALLPGGQVTMFTGFSGISGHLRVKKRMLARKLPTWR